MLSAFIAIAASAPSGLNEAPLLHQSIISVQPELRQVGAIVNHVPTAVSHQSRTDYHSKPVVKSILAPVDYIERTVHQSPAIAISSPAVYAHAAPLALAHHGLAHNYIRSAPLVHSGLVHSAIGAPLLRSW